MKVKEIIKSDEFIELTYNMDEMQALRAIMRLWDYCIRTRSWWIPAGDPVYWISAICGYRGDLRGRMDFFYALYESSFIDYVASEKRVSVISFPKFNPDILDAWNLSETGNYHVD